MKEKDEKNLTGELRERKIKKRNESLVIVWRERTTDAQSLVLLIESSKGKIEIHQVCPL